MSNCLLTCKFQSSLFYFNMLKSIELKDALWCNYLFFPACNNFYTTIARSSQQDTLLILMTNIPDKIDSCTIYFELIICTQIMWKEVFDISGQKNDFMESVRWPTVKKTRTFCNIFSYFNFAYFCICARV